MAYSDDDLIFPTRGGAMATGSANERKMLDNIGGANQTRTKIQYTEEGSKKTTTTLKTSVYGIPHFQTEITDDDEKPEEIYMDTGVVDLLSIAPGDPLSLASAPLYYGNIQRTYVTLKKLLGKIWPPRIKSSKPPEEGIAGKSFKAVDGKNLLAKKEAAAKCPASMFTGKARLYAQAHYGAKLADWKWELDIPLGLTPRLVHENGAVLTTHSGIYRDAQYKHWLINVHTTGVTITKLVRDDKVKPLVRHLRNPTHQADWDKIEAYILAYSIPSEEFQFNISVAGIPAPEMLGYGWKFNWSGDKADIISHVESSPLHSSTHYRLSFFRDTDAPVNQLIPPLEDEQNRWTIALSIIEGPISWHNTRYSQVIASPDWLTNTLYVFGTLTGGASGAGVPIYCFYNAENTLEVFRYSASGGASNLKYMVTSEPAQWMRPVDWTSENLGDYTHFGTSGLQGADGERRVRGFNPVSAGFSCNTMSAIVAAQSYTFSRYTMSAKTIVGDGPVWVTSNVGHNAYEHTCAANDTGWLPYYVTTDGIQRYTSGTQIIDELGASIGYAVGDYNNMCDIGYDRYAYSGSHVENHNTLLLIPFHDAEAAYMWGNLNTLETATVTGGYCEGRVSPGYFAWKETEVFSDGSDGYTHYPHYKYAGGDGTHLANNLDAQPDYENSTDQTTISKLVTRSGTYDFSPPSSMNPFFSGVPYVEQQYYTHSSTLGPVYGHGANNFEGFPNTFVSPPPFIGWA